LDYFGVRYFSAVQGRWTTADPKQLADRTVRQPQKWNKYVYAENNPLRFVDPDGQDDVAAAACMDSGACLHQLAEQRSKAPIEVAFYVGAAAAAVEGGAYLAAAGRGLLAWALGHPTEVQDTAASLGEGLSNAPPSSLTSGLSKLGATTEESVERKLSKYLLNPGHSVGGDKAKWFQQALGFTKENMGDLARQIVFDPKKAVQTGVTEFGTQYNQVITITGANGKEIEVTFAFIRNEDGVVRLVTAIPAAR
jgi:RHS repeat-associated protein